MSVICQTAELKYPMYLNQVNRLANVEAQLRLPEGSPPVAGIIGGDLTVESPGVAVGDDFVTVTGLIKPHLLYQTEKAAGWRAPAPAPRSAEGDEDEYGPEEETSPELAPEPTEYGVSWGGDQAVALEERIEFPGVRPEMMVTAQVKAAGCVFENAGVTQVFFRGRVAIAVEAVSVLNTTVVSDVTALAPEKLNVNRETVTVEEYGPQQQKAFQVEANLNLPKIKPGASRILTYDVRPVAVSHEVTRGRVAVKGFLEVSLAYVGCDDEGRPTETFMNEWGREHGTAVPFQTLLDGEYPEGNLIVAPRVNVSGAEIGLSSPYELRGVFQIEALVRVASARPREIVTEVSSASGSLLDSRKDLLSIEEYVGETEGEIPLNQTLELPAGGPGMERLLMHRPIISSLEAEGSAAKIMIQGSLDLWLLYMAEKDDAAAPQAASWERSAGDALPLNVILEAPQVQPGAILQANGVVESLQLEMVGARTVRVTGMVRVKVAARMARSFIVLRDCALVTPVDPATRPSMMFYVVQPGDTLWGIAREYQTLVDTLTRVNQIADPTQLSPGQKLLIPKTA